MRISNPWIGYVQRSYQQIKKDLVAGLQSKAPEITDYSENNPLVILLSMFAGLTEHLNYYIDVMAQELYINTLRRYTSAVKLANLLDYYSRGTTPAIVKIRISLLDNSGLPSPSSTDLIIPINTQFLTQDSSGVFITQKPYVVKAGVTVLYIEAYNIKSGYTKTLTTTNIGNPNQVYLIDDPYFCDIIPTITSGSETFTLVKTLAFSKAADKHFTIRLSGSGKLFIVFGDNIRGKIPLASTLTLNHSRTNGAQYNQISPGLIMQSSTDLLALTSGPTVIDIYNPESPNGGDDLETLEKLRIKIPASIRTLDRAVTYSDYHDLLQLVPGVEKGLADFCCNRGNGIDLYVLPHGGGIASDGLLLDVETFFDTRKMLNTKINAKPVSEILIAIHVEVIIFAGQNQALTQRLIASALQNEFSYLNQEINGSIRLSDITTLISNLEPVDYIKSLTITPLPYISGLIYTIAVYNTVSEKYQYTLLYQGSHAWVVYRDNVEVGSLITGDEYNDGKLVLTITSDIGIVTNSIFEFTIYPPNRDIEITDFSIATLNLADLNITVNQNSTLIKTKTC